MAKRVIFAGDANVDLVFSGLAAEPQVDREVFCEDYQATLGGSTTIAAYAYARLGGDCDFCGLVGEDEQGSLVADRLASAGVGISRLRRAPGLATGVTVSLVRGTSRTQVTFPGSLALTDETEVLEDLLASYKHLHISGIYGMPAFLPRVGGLLERALSLGLSTSLDTQWDASEEWRYAETWLPLLTWLFVNEDEALSLARRFFGRSEGLMVEEAWALLAERSPCPVIKLGARGAYAGGRLCPPAVLRRLLDSTGAGDTFAAAFLYASLEEGAGLEEALRLGAAAGALACSWKGGTSPLLSRAALEDQGA
ncbi:MAG TPA: carbohydrate kinase family protein [Rectinemataceae bacterium]|nr:carbohydrate kinase family protein [Rectinemataceae bacterium]